MKASFFFVALTLGAGALAGCFDQSDAPPDLFGTFALRWRIVDGAEQMKCSDEDVVQLGLLRKVTWQHFAYAFPCTKGSGVTTAVPADDDYQVNVTLVRKGEVIAAAPPFQQGHPGEDREVDLGTFTLSVSPPR
jgi:hypothetical protein